MKPDCLCTCLFGIFQNVGVCSSQVQDGGATDAGVMRVVVAEDVV